MIRFSVARSTAAGLIAIVASATGCQLAVNPFVDELACQPAVTTPSVECARRAENVAPRDLRRSYEDMDIRPKDGTVTFGPLYFVDPVENRVGDPDGRFAWTVQDYLLTSHSHAQFLVNAISFPLKVVVNPPWTVKRSDFRPRWTTFSDAPSRGINDGRSVTADVQVLAHAGGLAD